MKSIQCITLEDETLVGWAKHCKDANTKRSPQGPLWQRREDRYLSYQGKICWLAILCNTYVSVNKID